MTSSAPAHPADPSSLSGPERAALARAGRLMSLDALRGFDMLWILGGDALMRTLGPAVARQFEHTPWAGFTFYDLIFPLFLVMVGMSVVFSLSRLCVEHNRRAAMIRIARRSILLFALGIFYNGGMGTGWADIRVLGILQRIAICYAAAGVLFCFCRPRTLAAIAVALLLGYWGLMRFVPIRDVPLDHDALVARLHVPNPTPQQVRAYFLAAPKRLTGRFEPGLNLSNHLDFEYLPGRKYPGYWDALGLLGTLPAIANCLLGVFAALLIRRTDRSDMQKTAWLLAGGGALVALGWLWDLELPVVKWLWTSSYVLVAGGYSLLLLAVFYWVVDVRGWRGWCRPFVWVGMNPLTLYVASAVLGEGGYVALGRRIAGGGCKEFLDATITAGAGDFVVAAIGLAVLVVIARFLYRRQIFLRL